MIFFTYMIAELRRRRGRTILTALGLGIGVGLVVTVSSLSAGLDRAQASVLKPLTGVGTDMSVNRPISVSGDPRAAFARLSPTERAQLRSEMGEERVDFGNLKPGATFTSTTFRASQFSFPAAQVASIAALPGVRAAGGALTLSMSTITGTVPAQAQTPPAPGGEAEGGEGGGGEAGEAGHGGARANATTITGLDSSGLGPVTPAQLVQGTWFSTPGARDIVLDVAFARTSNTTVGSTFAVGQTPYRVVGLVKSGLAGVTSDAYVALPQLQQASKRVGRINTVYVRAASAGQVDGVAKTITSSFTGASVTTARTLANQVTGSLASARSLTAKLGLALEVVGLLGAVLIASLLSLSSVTKRVRELGTLKALGWSRRLVVRQVAGESLLQGVLGAVAGVALGLLGAGLITLSAPRLSASLGTAATASDRFGGEFGEGAAALTAPAQSVALSAQVSLGVIGLAVALAVAGGLLAGIAGAVRASSLRPVEALRHID